MVTPGAGFRGVRLEIVRLEKIKIIIAKIIIGYMNNDRIYWKKII